MSIKAIDFSCVTYNVLICTMYSKIRVSGQGGRVGVNDRNSLLKLEKLKMKIVIKVINMKNIKHLL